MAATAKSTTKSITPSRVRVDRLDHLRPRGLRAEAGQAPGGTRRDPRCGVGSRPVCDHELERRLRAGGRAQRLDLAGELGERLGAGQLDRKEPVPARGAADRPPVRPDRRRPDRDARALERPRLELAVPVGLQAIEPFVKQPGTRPRVALLAEAPGVELAGAPAPEPHPEDEPASAEPVEADGLARELVRAPARERSDQCADNQPLGGNGDRGERDPWVGEGADRLAVAHVVPHEEAVPAARLGALREIGHHARLRQLLEGGDEDAVARAHARRTGNALSWLIRAETAYCGVPASSIAG